MKRGTKGVHCWRCNKLVYKIMGRFHLCKKCLEGLRKWIGNEN